MVSDQSCHEVQSIKRVRIRQFYLRTVSPQFHQLIRQVSRRISEWTDKSESLMLMLMLNVNVKKVLYNVSNIDLTNKYINNK